MHLRRIPAPFGGLSMLVWRKLTEHRLRSTLTALAVTLGVAMLLAAAIVSGGWSEGVGALCRRSAHRDWWARGL